MTGRAEFTDEGADEMIDRLAQKYMGAHMPTLGVTANEPVVFAFGPLVLAAAAAAAVWLPARRATAAAPMTAIRN